MNFTRLEAHAAPEEADGKRQRLFGLLAVCCCVASTQRLQYARKLEQSYVQSPKQLVAGGHKMTLVLTSLAILALLGLNHAIHGAGCWGFQPGGGFSALLFDVQTLTSLIAVGWALYRLFTGHQRTRFIVIGAGFVVAAAAVACYVSVGWRMHTSIHNQGPENLPTFFLTSLVAILLGGYKWWTARRGSGCTDVQR